MRKIKDEKCWLYTVVVEQPRFIVCAVFDVSLFNLLFISVHVFFVRLYIPPSLV